MSLDIDLWGDKKRFFRTIEYKPFPFQEIVHRSPARFRVAAGGARCGKSICAGAEGAYTLMWPGRHIWYCSALFELADKEYDWTLEFLSKVKMNGKNILNYARISNPQRGSRRLEFPWGSWAETKSTTRPESLLGEELDLLIFGEASQISGLVWDRQLRARLGPRKGKMIALSTPNWDSMFFRTLYEKGQKENEKYNPDYESWQVSVLDNLGFDRNEYENAKASLPKEVFEEQYEGKFTSRRGLVITLQDSNIVDYVVSADFPVFRTVYHIGGTKNPMVCIFFAVNPDTKELVAMDETYCSETLFVDFLEEINKKSRGKRIISTIVDRQSKLLFSLFRESGVYVSNLSEEKDISEKMAIVKKIDLLKLGLIKNKIAISRNCVNLIKDFSDLKWKESNEDREIDKPEDPLPSMTNFAGVACCANMLAYNNLVQGNNFYIGAMKCL